METSLELILLPNGHLELEQSDVPARISKEREELERIFEKHFVESPPGGLFYLGTLKTETSFSSSVEFWRSFAREFTEQLRLTPDIEHLRENISLESNSLFLEKTCLEAPFMQGAEYLSCDLLDKYWHDLLLFFQQQIKSWKGTVEAFYQKYAPEAHLVGKIYFHLVENKDASQAPFAFLATYASSVTESGKSKHRPLKYALTEYEKKEGKLLELLSTVREVAKKSSFINKLLDDGELFYPLALKQNDTYTFLQEVPLYEEAGILCRIPNWWKRRGQRIGVSVSIGNKKVSLLGLDSLVDFKAELVLDGVSLSPEEARDLLEQSEGLAYLKGKWVSVNHNQLREALDNWEKARSLTGGQNINLSEAFRLLMAPQDLGGNGVTYDTIEVSCGKWLESIYEKMRNPALVKAASVGCGFSGELRPYQQLGLNWLALLDSLGLGACLADDMGLGKTIQVLAFLNSRRRKKGSSTHLLVVPASLIFNWVAELNRFSPRLKYRVAHPSGGRNSIGNDCNPGEIETNDLIITTYSMVKRYDFLSTFNWDYIILDEAQAIKNSGTAQTRAVKKLNGRNRLILTGTPIENRLSDLWSLFDFLNPGLLGTNKEFSSICKSTNGDTKSYARIRAAIRPYILRRLKTDKSVISDLPEKIELETYAPLTKKQVVFYQKVVKELERSIETMDGIQRKGLVLATLMKLKQLCNHPAQYLGEHDYSESQSGKFQRLREICETIYEKREKVLIFTQFKEITEPLSDFLAQIFHRRGLILTGSTAVKKRHKLIASFQKDDYIPYFILSLKAGGTGLNLTAATHVIHFDRWWNPAVENQATDRAFRIGQKKNVVVHKFITKGTIEEKIAAMLSEKSKLFSDIIETSADKFITEMDNKELIELFKMKAA